MGTASKQLTRRLFLFALLATNVLLWVIPSNVVELVARDRQTLLGRYSREHFSWIVAVLIVSLVVLYVDRAAAPQRKTRWFQVIATLLLLVPSMLLVDFLARAPQRAHYVRDSLAYHRPANINFTVDFVDEPEAKRTYPNAKHGFGSVECVYHTDGRGFRNATTSDHVDVVVLGDSFAEGSKVSDGDAWPVRFGRSTGVSVYNLGMSGYAPVNYVVALRQYGLKLSPKVIMCMLYEGNDFRSTDSSFKPRRPRFLDRLHKYVKQSPVVNALDRLFIDTLAPIGSHRDVPGMEVLSWMPLSVPAGESAKSYAFAPKQLLGLMVSEKSFSQGKRWKNVASLLTEMKQLCRDANAQMVLVYAPTKAHVMMPVVRDQLVPEKVRAFGALRANDLPAANAFLGMLFARISTMRSVVARWCREQGVIMIDPTDALREHAVAGQQVYYTYDQHWTPIGHDVVASVVQGAWKRRLGANSTDLDTTDLAVTSDHSRR